MMIKNKTTLILNDYIIGIVVAVVAYQINNYFGFIGLNPTDSFLIFGSGDRVLKGDLPFKDYWIVSGGPLIDIMQSFVFKILGVSWSSFVIHASILNSIFSISIFFYARLTKLSKKTSLFFAILSSFIMYPAAGTPQTDHHSIIIGSISLIFFIIFLKKKNYTPLFFFPIIFLGCFFIKQVPAAYYIILICLISLFYYLFEKQKEIIINLLLGSIIAFAVFFLILKINNILVLDVYKQYVALIIQGFNVRVDSYAKALVFDNILKIKYIILLLIPFVVIVAQNLKKIELKKKESFYLDIYLFMGLIVSSALHESYTNNQSVTFGLLPIYSIIILSLIKENKSKILFYIFSALSIIGVLRLINENEIYLILLIIFPLIYFFGSKYNISLKKTSSLVVVYTLLIALLYFETIVRNRYWHDIVNPNWDNAVAAEQIDLKLKGLVWLSGESNTQKEILNIENNLSYLKSLDENYIIVTNYQIYNAILDIQNFSPVRYWWNKLSYPSKGNKYRNEFDVFFQNKINKNNVKKIIVLSDINQENVDINEFEWLKDCTLRSQKNEKIKILNVITQC